MNWYKEALNMVGSEKGQLASRIRQEANALGLSKQETDYYVRGAMHKYDMYNMESPNMVDTDYLFDEVLKQMQGNLSKAASVK